MGAGRESVGMPRQAHAGGRREGCGGTGGRIQVTIVNTSRKKRKEKIYLLAQAGRHGHRQVGGHRQEWARGEKRRHAQTGACGRAQGKVWRHEWAHAGYNREHKQKKKLTYWHRRAGAGTGR